MGRLTAFTASKQKYVYFLMISDVLVPCTSCRTIYPIILLRSTALTAFSYYLCSSLFFKMAPRKEGSAAPNTAIRCPDDR